MQELFKRENYGNVVVMPVIDMPLKDFYESVCIDKEKVNHALTSSVVFVPAGYPQNPAAFPVGVLDFYSYCCKQMDGQVTYCADGFQTIELCSLQLRLGRFVVAGIVLPFFLNILSNFVYDKAKNFYDNNQCQIEAPYQEEASVSFEVVVADSAGVQTKTFKYEGPVSGVESATSSIKTLWEDEKSK